MDENPFRQALEWDREFTAPPQVKGEQDAPPKLDQLRTIVDLNLVDPSVVERNPKVARLTVRDLNDLAEQFYGIPTENPNIAELTIEDMQDIEGIFLEYKLNEAQQIIRGGLELTSVDVSCCCTTPCCCCAAADVEPTRA